MAESLKELAKQERAGTRRRTGKRIIASGINNGAFRMQWAGKSRGMRSKDQPTMIVMPWFHASTRRAARCENVDMRVLQGRGGP